MNNRDITDRLSDSAVQMPARQGNSSTWAVGVRDDGNGEAYVAVFFSVGDALPSVFCLSEQTAMDLAAALASAADIIALARKRGAQ